MATLKPQSNGPLYSNEPQSQFCKWLGLKPVESDNYQVRSAPDACRPLQKSQNGVDADQDHAARRANVRLHTRKLTRRPRTVSDNDKAAIQNDVNIACVWATR